jgi:ribosomal protein S18 acetylase RimI-like enzyme
MEVASLGLQTDLALLERSGSTIEDCGDHLVVRTPHNPTFYWGNFLVLDRVPPVAEVDEWLERFVAALPGARHRAIAFDRPDGTVDELVEFAERGLTVDASTVMTARSVQPPPHPNTEATYRAFSSDDDWAQSVTLTLACHDGYEKNHLEFVTLRAESNRELTADGQGAWFGAFVDGRLVTQMGLVRAGDGLARFQSVETDPAFRRRGLAGTLVHHVGEFGFAELGAETLVMVADPNDDAIRVYRSVGFTATESALGAELAPPTT